MNSKGFLVVLSAPSGCGKDTIFNELKKIRNDVVESVSATTRAPRENEVDGVNYYFKTQNEFKAMIEGEELLEYASYNNNYYGTPLFGVESAINDGKICFLIIEVKGAKKVIDKIDDAVSIFILPPDKETLKKRLIGRGTDSDDNISNRLDIAKEELTHANDYKYRVINDDLEVAVNEINNILNNEIKSRTKGE